MGDTRGEVLRLIRETTLGAIVVIGAVVGAANGSGSRDAPLLGAMLGALDGATNGVMVVGAILGAEILLPPTALRVYAIAAKPSPNGQKTT